MGSSTEHSAYGPTHNPWDLDRIPGGSGGGSAAAVAAFEAPLAIGTDTGGSIRQPGAVTGTVGVKPTYGGVSRYGLVALANSLDQAGPVTRTVLDAACCTRSIAGHDPLDSTSIDQPVPPVVQAARDGAAGDLAGVRIGVVNELGGEGYQPGVQQRFDEAVELLVEAGAEVVEVVVPALRARAGGVLPDPAERGLQQPRQVRRHALRPAGAARGRRRHRAPRRSCARPARPGFGDEVKRRIILGTYALSSGYYDAYYGQAQKVRTLISRDFERGLRAGRRAGLADRADHGVQARREARRPAGDVPQRRRHHPGQPRRACPASRCRAGSPTRTACPVGLPDPRAGARRRPALPRRRGRSRRCWSEQWGGPLLDRRLQDAGTEVVRMSRDTSDRADGLRRRARAVRPGAWASRCTSS